MKFMLLIYANENAWSDDERQQCYEDSARLTRELHAQGKYVSANPLMPVTNASSVRVRDGKPVVTDGPFAETREQLGGYFLVDVRDEAEAIEIAGRIPGARKGTVEVRPVLDIPGLPRTETPLVSNASR